MTLSEIRKSDKTYLFAADIAGLLETAPETIRDQARKDPRAFPFPCIVVGNRIKFPRTAVLRFFDGIAP